MEEITTRAVAKFVRVSPSKAGQVMSLIRGKNAAEAVNILEFCIKGAAVNVNKVLKSAIANAERNHNLSLDDLMVAEAYADQGPTLKRIRPRAMGRAAPIRKRTSHITVVLREQS